MFLSTSQQWDLYGYFYPHRSLSDIQLRERHRTCLQRDPSLPHRAGRALKRIEPLLRLSDEQWIAGMTPLTQGGTKQVKVYPLVLPEPDYTKLARAFIALARHRL